MRKTKVPNSGWTETLVMAEGVAPPREAHDIAAENYLCVKSSYIPLAEFEELEEIYDFLNATEAIGRVLCEFDIISLHAEDFHESFLAVAKFRASQFGGDEDIIERADLPMALVRLPHPLPQFHSK